MEGEFRASHKKVIDHSEEIAFYNGNNWELNKLNDVFKTLTNHLNLMYVKKFFMGIFDSMLVKFGATIIGTCILALPVFTGRFARYNQDNKNSNAAEITKDFIHNNALLVNLAKAIGKFIGTYKDLQTLSGYTFLVKELSQVVDDVKYGKYDRKQVDEDIIKKYTGGKMEEADFIEFNDVPIITPNGEALVENINFKVSKTDYIYIIDFARATYFY